MQTEQLWVPQNSGLEGNECANELSDKRETPQVKPEWACSTSYGTECKEEDRFHQAKIAVWNNMPENEACKKAGKSIRDPPQKYFSWVNKG